MDDFDVQRRWDELVRRVIEAKAARGAALRRLVDAQEALAQARIPDDIPDDAYEAHPAVVESRAAGEAYQVAEEAVEAAQAAMNAGVTD